MKTPPVPISPQWGEAWNQFERAHYHQAASSIRDRRAMVDALARWLTLPENGAIMDPADVTRSHLSAYMSLAETTRKGSGALTLYAGLRVFFRWYAGEFKGCDECAQPDLYKNHGCRLNPMYGVRRPSPSKHKSAVVPVPTEGQLDAVLASLSGRDFISFRDRALISLLADTGMRREEVRQLDRSDVDLSRKDGGIARVRVSKTMERPVVFSAETSLYLNRLLRMHPLKDSPEWPDVPLFTNSTGGRVSPQTVGVIVRRAGERAGIQFADGRGFHPHQLRHHWTDGMYRQGVPDSVMRQLGGWRGRIPETYGQGAAEDRAVEYGLRMISENGKRKR